MTRRSPVAPAPRRRTPPTTPPSRAPGGRRPPTGRRRSLPSRPAGDRGPTGARARSRPPATRFGPPSRTPPLAAQLTKSAEPDERRTPPGFHNCGDGGNVRVMTIVYGGAHWDLEEDGVRVHLVGEEPKVVALDALPLPVARVLRSLGFQPSA